MNTADKVKKTFRDYIREKFNQDADNLKIYIYGTEMQICGGILKFEDELDITLMHFDLRYVGYKYMNHTCFLPEMCVPFPENAIVLVSCIYQYKYEEIVKQLTELGLKPEQMIHVKDLAIKLLDMYAESFSQNAMDKRVMTLFKSIEKDVSQIRYLDIGANMWLLYNNSYAFYRGGANGVLVEANLDFVDEIKQNRSRDIAIMCGCSDAESSEEWTYYKTKHAGYNTFVKEIADTYPARNIDVQEIKISMKYIGEILEENFKDGHVDYMSVDIEGMGVRVVNAIDFSKYKIDVILLEMDYDEEESRKLYLKLLDLGYIAKYRGIGAGKDFLFYRKDVFGTEDILGI